MKRFLIFFSFILFLAMQTINLPFIARTDEQIYVYDQQKELVKFL